MKEGERVTQWSSNENELYPVELLFTDESYIIHLWNGLWKEEETVFKMKEMSKE